MSFLTSEDGIPSDASDVDRLHVRDNLKMAITDAESSKGNALLRAAGQGLRTSKQVAAKTAEVRNFKHFSLILLNRS